MSDMPDIFDFMRLVYREATRAFPSAESYSIHLRIDSTGFAELNVRHQPSGRAFVAPIMWGCYPNGDSAVERAANYVAQYRRYFDKWEAELTAGTAANA